MNIKPGEGVKSRRLADMMKNERDRRILEKETLSRRGNPRKTELRGGKKGRCSSKSRDDESREKKRNILFGVWRQFVESAGPREGRGMKGRHQCDRESTLALLVHSL